MTKPQTSVMSFPTRVVSGPGVLSTLAEELRRLGCSRPLVVSDPNLGEIGLVAKVNAALEAGGLPRATYLGVSPNPVEQDVLGGVDAYKAAEADALVALGGGAPMDVAKAIRVMVAHDHPLADFEESAGGYDRIVQPLPPMVAIATTAGTGSEVGRSTVISLGENHRKAVIFHPSLLPDVAVLDAELTVGLPPKVTAATGMDALTHALEAYVSPGYHPFGEAFALSALGRIGTYLPLAVKDGGDLMARQEMLLASAMAAVAFQKNLGACHSLAHALSSVTNMHHGTANAVMLPHVIAFNYEAAPAAYAACASALGVDGEGPEGLISLVRGWLADFGLPATLGEAGVEAAQIDPMLPLAMADGCHAGNPRPLTEADARRLYEAAL